MMDLQQPKFFQSAFEIENLDGNRLKMRGLFSRAGITKIFLSMGLPDDWQFTLGKVVVVHLEKVNTKGVLVQQHVEHGSFYEVKFHDLAPPFLTYLEERLKADGGPPGWQRKFPRIPVKGYEDPELPVPNLCLVRAVGEEIFVNVMNFTIGGIRIETQGDSLGDIRVGSLLHFDMFTSSDETLESVSAEVRNIAIHERQFNSGANRTRSFGMRLLEMNPANDQKYRSLIRDYCTVLQKRFEAVR
jgi:hypothetical protein